MPSDLVAFRLNDPAGYEIVAELDFCGACVPIGPGGFRLTGRMHADFGPYTVAGCDPGDGHVLFSISVPTDFQAIMPPVGEAKLVPVNPDQPFPRDPGPPLRTACVAAGNLDYSIPNFALIGNLGARTPGFDPAILLLPENVRGVEDDGSLARRNDLAPFSFRHDLTFETTETKTALSPFRYWPEGLPFRLGPASITYTASRVSFTTPGMPVGPPAFQPTPPDPSNIPDDPFVPGGVIRCDEADGVACGAIYTYNGGYFEGSWLPQNASFDVGGLDVDLALPETAIATYEPAFPRGVKITLSGAGALAIRDSAIDQGSFGGGTARLRYESGQVPSRDCDGTTISHVLPLRASPLEPRVQAHGALLAGITDLNASSLFFVWSHNGAEDLGCGTLYAPPVVSARGSAAGAPQEEWLASAVAPVLGRGIYAGVNYNRNAPAYSPRCDPLPPEQRPTWTTHIEGDNPPFEIVPGEHPDREMVFFARASGVTGVFDGGPGPVSIGDPDGEPPTFDVDFDRFGLAFKNSSNEGEESLLDGRLNLRWPSATTLPFTGLSVCACGSLNSAQVPEAVAERNLAYWDARFRPYGIDFSRVADPAVGCLDPASRSCDCPAGDPECVESISQRVCISAITPVPHFTPEPDAKFGVEPAGQPDRIQPVSLTEFVFEANDAGLEPYAYHATHFEFSDWDAALDPDGDGTGPSECQVTDPDCVVGFLDAAGQIILPYFGLRDAGIKVQRTAYPGGLAFHQADLHRKGIAHVGTSFIEVSHKFAADTVDLGFRIDYFPPSMTADLDGSDEPGRGRGLLLGFSFNADPMLADKIDLGALPAGAGILLEPRKILSDFGPAGALRLWANAADTGTLWQTGRDMLANILPADRLESRWRTGYQRVVDEIGRIGGCPPPLSQCLGPPDSLADLLHTERLIDEFRLDDLLQPHPDFASLYNVAGDLVHPSPETIAKRVAGYLDFSPGDGVIGDLATEVPELARIEADIASLDASGKEFFAFARSQLDVQRYVREAESAGEQALMELGRNALPGSMKLPGKQDIGFPNLPGVSWDFDYDVAPALPPIFTFRSLTGSLDLTQGGLSGLGFNELGATLKFYADGDWYFEANAEIDFNQVAAEGDLLLGNTKDMTPLRSLDPGVVDFLGEIERFNGAYARVGMRRNWINLGCPLTLSTRLRVGGWYLGGGDTFGGLVSGRLSGEGACVVSVTGDITMMGGMQAEIFRMRGDYWVAGGIGYDCDEDRWDSPSDVLHDGGCFACVVDTGCEFTYPGSRLDCHPPRTRCR